MKKKFLSVLAVFSVVVLVSTSCKKSSSTPASEGQIVFTENGTTYTYSTNATGTIVADGTGGTVASLFAESGTNVITLGADATTSSSISTSTNYTDTSFTNIGILNIGTTTNAASASSEFATNHTLQLKFTSVSASNVQGTFSGNVANSDGSGQTAITNGSFNVNIH